MYLVLHRDRLATILEVAAAFGISANDPMKVVQHLGTSGEVLTLRGPRGGSRLARTAGAIRVGRLSFGGRNLTSRWLPVLDTSFSLRAGYQATAVLDG
jgi:hypothetical protein